MSHRSSVRELAAAFRDPSNRLPVVLIGAGASATSGVPLAAKLAATLVRRNLHAGVRAIPREWRRWVDDNYVDQHRDAIADQYPLVVRRLLKTDYLRSHVLPDLLWPKEGISSGYRRLADLVDRGLVRTILTTNFDDCLRIALSERYKTLRRFAEINRMPGDIAEIDVDNRAQIVWLHGRLEQFSDLNYKGDIARPLDPVLRQKLYAILDQAPLIVVGYRGSEPSIMDHFLSTGPDARGRYSSGIFWCNRIGDATDARVGKLKSFANSDHRRRMQELAIVGFDELMADLVWAVFDVGRESGHLNYSQQNFTTVDGLAPDRLSAMWWDRNSWQHVDPNQRGFSVRSLKKGIIFYNGNQDYNHGKLLFKVLLLRDFDIEIDISGAYLDIQLQDANGRDQNLYIDPPARRAILGPDISQRTKFLIKRSGSRVGFATVVEGHTKMLDYHSHETDGAVVAFLAVAIQARGTIEVRSVSIRTP